MYIERCTYHCLPGRLPALLKRFETATLRLFEKHGFRPVGFFVTEFGPSRPELMYMLKWDSLDQRMAAWTAFRNDPEWHEARIASESDGMLVDMMSNEIMIPTAFSPLK
ncbi:NIPSNAP family protein [Noviherbaspirillum sedimenti]|uniref:NIPSNAP family protein n=1 Tax=Noviherbaspirillum sedimenti TaxID=2320865 RepID=A0A3A3G466_9BURK|nr:NIPSNAP family protein [Noviherbaspirillum sedimenti]RJG03283.1 NIPSNAP family protein [Noviherbaspirillum sedimenti]